jgi:putative addiction module CopG family antidote
MINVTLPPEIELFVHQAVAEGRYPSEQALLTDAIRFLRDSKIPHERLRGKIDAALAEVDRGLGIEIDDDDSLTTFFDELEAEVHATIAAEPKNNE